MAVSSFFGYAGAVLSALIFLPQVVKTVRSRNTDDLSLGTFIILTVTNACWMTYAILTKDHAIILSQSFLLPMGAAITVYKLIYK